MGNFVRKMRDEKGMWYNLSMSSKESLGQEVLSWNPYADLPEMASETQEAAAEGQLSAKPEEMTRQQKREIGVVAIAGMLESGADEGVKDAAEEKTLENEAAVDASDTVINRAEQALGVGPFGELVQGMMESAEEDEPQTTMRKFRDSAGVSLMDAGELWQAVVAQSKRERYPEIEEYREHGKFYCALDMAGLEKALMTGKIERTDKSGNSLKSDLSLSGDRLENGEWQPGFEEGRAVTLVLDGTLVDKEDFVALRQRPTVDEIDLRKYCLGFVSDFRSGVGRKVNQMVRRSSFSGIPVYQQYDQDELVWSTKVFPAEALREQLKEYSEQMQDYEAVRAEIYDDVDYEGLNVRVEELAAKMDLEKMMDIVARRSRMTKEQAELELLRYFSDVLGTGDLPELTWIDDENALQKARHRHGRGGKPSQVEVNSAKLNEDDLVELAETLGHESKHRQQRLLVEKMQEEPESLDEPTRRLAELYDMNFKNYIRAKDDPVGYSNQLVEVDARMFGMACKKICRRALKEVNKPINRVKRGASAVKQGVVDLAYKGKRVRKVA